MAMTTRLNDWARSRFPPPPHCAALIVMGFGLMGLLGWVYDVRVLREFASKGVGMKTNTSIALTLSGLSLWLLTAAQTTRRRGRWFAIAAAAMVFLIGSAVLTEHLAGWDLGIDQIFFIEPPGEPATVSPNRTGPPAAIGFVLAGTCLLLLSMRRRLGFCYQALVIILGLTASLSIFGYAFGAEPLYGLPKYTGIGLHTSVAFIALTAGLLLARPNQGLMALLLDPGVAGAVLRRLLPPAIVLPFVLGWLHVEGERTVIHDSAFGAAIMMLLFMVILTTLVLVHAVALGRTDQSRRNAEESLRKSKALLSRAQQVAKLGSWEWDIASRGLVWSDEMYYVFGFAPDAFQPSHDAFLAAVGSENRENIEAAMEEAFAGRPYYVECKLTHPDASIHHILVQGEVDFDAQGQPVRMFGTAIDITERKRTEESLRENEKRYRTLAEYTADFIVLCETSGRTVYWSPSCIRLLDWTEEEIDVADFVAAWRIRVHPQDRHIVEQTRSVGRLGKERIIAYRQRKKGGEYAWLESRIQPIFDTRGAPHRFLIVSRDITERKQAEETARQGESILQVISENMEDAIYVKDRESRMLFVNPAALRIVGKPASLIIGRTAAELYDDPAVGAAILENDRRLMESGIPHIFEEIIESPVGRRVLLSSKMPWRDSEGRVIGLIGISRDITDRKQGE
jgi:PAS domain S-box-containing protein